MVKRQLLVIHDITAGAYLPAPSYRAYCAKPHGPHLGHQGYPFPSKEIIVGSAAHGWDTASFTHGLSSALPVCA